MNFSIYVIFLLVGCSGVFLGLKFKNQWILIPSMAAAVISAILIIASLLLIFGIK